MNAEETYFNEWARHEFRINTGQLATLFVVLSGYRIFERPMTREAIEQVLLSQYGCEVGANLATLERLGWVMKAWKYGPTGNRKTWVPTPRALTRFPEPEPERELPSVVSVRIGRKRLALETKAAS